MGEAECRDEPGKTRPSPIVSMSFQLAIPWRVALQQSPPPLHQSLPASAKLERWAMLLQRMVIVPYIHCLSRGVQSSCENGAGNRALSPFLPQDDRLKDICGETDNVTRDQEDFPCARSCGRRCPTPDWT